MDDVSSGEPGHDRWWPPDETLETDVDDDFDWDLELGLIEPGPDPGPPRAWVPPPPRVWPVPEHDPQVVSVGTGEDVGEFVRACRAQAGFSQRALAVAAGVPHSTVARLESGRVADTARLGTLLRVTAACGVRLGGVVAGAEGTGLLHTDLAQRHLDHGGRMLPAHLENRPVPDWHGGWVGDDRHARRRGRPRHVYRLADGPADGPADGAAR